MSRFLVEGGHKLSGELTVQGAKNSVLPILAATVITRGETVLLNCPRLRDVETSVKILQYLGCAVHWEGSALIVDSSGLNSWEISDALMREMRSSAVYLGALLTRCGRAKLSYPGGCELGPRPIDLHLSGLRRLGAEIREEGGVLDCRAERLRGREIVLSMPSVGATENLMLAACGGTGVTRIVNAAREPEIEDLQNFLRACGARVYGGGTSTVVVEGGQSLHGCTYRIMPDRIATATYLCAVATAGGEVRLLRARGSHLSTVTALLNEAGCRIREDAEAISLRKDRRLRAVGPVRTAPYPGFPTDAQAVLMAALLTASGSSVFEENIFSSRYRHVDEMTRMGGSIRVSGRVAVVTGVEKLHGARVCASDLRGGAALVIAALGAAGHSEVLGGEHIERGYEDFAGTLRTLGASVTWAQDERTGDSGDGQTQKIQSQA